MPISEFKKDDTHTEKEVVTMADDDDDVTMVAAKAAAFHPPPCQKIVAFHPALHAYHRQIFIDRHSASAMDHGLGLGLVRSPSEQIPQPTPTLAE